MAVYRGKIVSFDSGTWTAVIRLDGSAAQTLTSVATARNIASAEMTAGRRVVLDSGDHNNPADFVVTAVWA
jgi:molybdopterin-binding protein